MTIDEPELAIIAIHGNGGGGFRFDRMHDFIPAGVELCCPTLPGFADTPRNLSLNCLSDYADVLNAIVENQRAKHKILLGHGIGGSIALDYLQRHARNVDGLILHAPVGALLDKRIFPRLLRLPGVALLGQRIFASPVFRTHFAKKLFVRTVPADFQDRFFGEYRNCSVFADMFEMINKEWFQALNPVLTPTTLLWGPKDNVLSDNQLEAFLRLLHQPQIVRPADWAHFPMCDMPDAYTATVVQLARELAYGGSETHHA